MDGTVFENEAGPARCPEHNRELGLYCKSQSCKKVICQRCFMQDHRDHDVKDLEDARAEVDAEMKQAIDNTESVKQHLREKYEKEKKRFSKDLRMLETRRKTVSLLFNDMRGKLEQSRLSTLDAIQKNIADLEIRTDAFQELKNSKKPISECADFSASCQGNLVAVRREMEKLKHYEYIKGSDISEELVASLCGRVVEKQEAQMNRNASLRQTHYVNVQPGQRL